MKHHVLTDAATGFAERALDKGFSAATMRGMWHQFFVALALCVGAMFPIINPVGHAPMFYMMTEADSPAFRCRQAYKTSLWVFVILFVSMTAGSHILNFFAVTLADLRIAGGVLIARSAWKMLGNTSRITDAEKSAAADKDDISLTPMATPILSGPGAMSLAIGLLSYGHTPADYLGYIVGFFVIAFTTWLCLHFSEKIVLFLGVNGAGALNRILGFLILAIGVNLIVHGLKDAFLSSEGRPIPTFFVF
ncbi:MAG: MarC family protein [Chthoniobacterales bacterium]